MDQQYNLKEYLNFIKNYKKTIILTIISIVLLFIGGLVVNHFMSTNTQTPDSEQVQLVEDTQIIDEELANEYLNTDFDTLSEDQQAELIQYLDQEAYLFRFYIENEEAEPYREYKAIKEIFTTKNIEEELESSTSAEFLPDIKRAVRLEFNESSNIHTFLIGTGNQEANLAFIQEYYRIFEEKTLPFFDNKDVYLIDDAPIQNQVRLEESETVPTDLEPESQSQGTNVVLLILVIILAIILGVILSFLQNYFKKEISYLYNYQLINGEKLTKLTQLRNENKKTKMSTIDHLIGSTSANKIIVTKENNNEYIDSIRQNTENKQNITIASSILDIDTAMEVHEIYIFTTLNKTKKEWYKQQLQLARNYEAKITVIQID